MVLHWESMLIRWYYIGKVSFLRRFYIGMSEAASWLRRWLTSIQPRLYLPLRKPASWPQPPVKSYFWHLYELIFEPKRGEPTKTLQRHNLLLRKPVSRPDHLWTQAFAFEVHMNLFLDPKRPTYKNRHNGQRQSYIQGPVVSICSKKGTSWPPVKHWCSVFLCYLEIGKYTQLIITKSQITKERSSSLAVN